MTDTSYAVLLHGEHVGTILRRDADTTFTTFGFDRDYWHRPDRQPLGLWFENHPRQQPRANNSVPAWFSNLLPEGRLRELIAREQGVSVHREMDFLERIGGDLPGAVEVRREAGAADIGLPEAGEETVQPALGSHAIRFSLAGMALKFSMRATGDRLALPAHGEDGDWILKTPDSHYPQLPANEDAMMDLARRTSITVPETALRPRSSVDDLGPGAWLSDETQAYTVRRFDRSPSGRIHIEDFAQVLGVYGVGDGKYRSNVETVIGLSWRGSDNSSLQEAVRRSVFNLLIGNGDAHLKNWSLIYPDGTHARLSPAYDLVCTAVYPEPEGDPELGLPFFGARRLSEVHREHFTRLQNQLGVGRTDVLDVVDDTLERFSETWSAGAAAHAPAPVAEWIDAHLADTRQRLLGH